MVSLPARDEPYTLPVRLSTSCLNFCTLYPLVRASIVCRNRVCRFWRPVIDLGVVSLAVDPGRMSPSHTSSVAMASVPFAAILLLSSSPVHCDMLVVVAGAEKLSSHPIPCGPSFVCPSSSRVMHQYCAQIPWTGTNFGPCPSCRAWVPWVLICP